MTNACQCIRPGLANPNDFEGHIDNSYYYSGPQYRYTCFLNYKTNKIANGIVIF